MSKGIELVEVWRGGMIESLHHGHAVVCDVDGKIIESWGDPGAVIYPRSACKMIQALPLVESGAADAAGLGEAELALACASHQGAAIHTDRVGAWLGKLGLQDSDYRCGPEEPRERDARDAMIRAYDEPCRMHNNCSGKHTGFLTLTKHLGAGPEYTDIDHPVQVLVREAYEDVTGEVSPGYGIDGCSAPNFAVSLKGLARAMAFFATADDRDDPRSKAAVRLRRAMAAYPELVAGEGRACTELMRAMAGRASIKTGAEGVFVAILPEKGLGIAVKCEDGTQRAAESVIAALLIKYGVLERDHPTAVKRLDPTLRNWAGLAVGEVKPVAGIGLLF